MKTNSIIYIMGASRREVSGLVNLQRQAELVDVLSSKGLDFTESLSLHENRLTNSVVIRAGIADDNTTEATIKGLAEDFEQDFYLKVWGDRAVTLVRLITDKGLTSTRTIGNLVAVSLEEAEKVGTYTQVVIDDTDYYYIVK